MAPVLVALSSSVIEVSFSPPLRPQGNVTMYTVTRLSLGTRTFTFSLPTLPPPSADGAYVFNDTDLLPFSNYSYVLRVCTSAGCTDSDTSVERTLEDMPTGLTTPTAVIVSSSEIMVLWEEPSMPNGVIQTYDLFRVSFGFDSSGGEAVNCCEEYVTMAGFFSEQCSQVITTATTEYLDRSLDPFSYYSYCIVASNNVDSGFSALTPPMQTSPASMPLVGTTLNATTINSTDVLLQWDALDVSDLLGPLEGYTLYVRISGTPGLGEVLFVGDEQMFIATNLLASTDYVFVVEVSNGVGSSLSNNATTTTEEGST